MAESKTLVRRTGKPSLAAINALTHDDRVWMAGFFDGEGSAGLYRKFKNGAFYSVTTRINVSQTGNEMLALFFEAFGGALTLIDRPDRKESKHTQYWTWTCDATVSASLFLQTVQPFLRVKGAEADLMLEFFNNMHTYTLEQKGMLIDRLATLKQRVATHILGERRDQLRSMTEGG